jgi:ABC-type sulfate transport system substrate-binding protein
LLNWENELWLARDEFGKDNFEIVYLSSSILGEPPVAVVDEVVDKKGTREIAEAYLKFLYTPEAQEIIATALQAARCRGFEEIWLGAAADPAFHHRRDIRWLG